MSRCVSLLSLGRVHHFLPALTSQAKAGELKEYLKANKQPQAGEKEELVSRVTLHVQSRALKIDDKDPFELKPAELRKACAQVVIVYLCVRVCSQTSPAFSLSILCNFSHSLSRSHARALSGD